MTVDITKIQIYCWFGHLKITGSKNFFNTDAFFLAVIFSETRPNNPGQLSTMANVAESQGIDKRD